MNTHSFQPILAHGETLLLPALLLMVAVVTASVWTWLNTLNGGRSRTVFWCAVLLTAVGALMSVAVLTEVEWQDIGVSLSFWALPLACGLAALRNIRRTRKQ